jgi:hypothetical protein
MKVKAILSLSTLVLGMGAVPSFAGEAFVTNSSSWQNITNGYGRSDTTFHESYDGSRLAVAGAVKYENGYSYTNPERSSQPVTNYESSKPGEQYGSGGSEGSRKPGEQYSSGDSERSYNPNTRQGYTYTASSYSLNAEFGNFHQTTDSKAYQSYNFTGGSNSHSVSSGFRY